MATLHEAFPTLVEWASVDRTFEIAAYAEFDLTDVVGSSAWPALVAALTETVMSGRFDGSPLAELMPGLKLWSHASLDGPDTLEHIRPLSVRAGNCLKRAGVSTWGNLTDKCVQDLAALRNFGRKSELEVIEACIELSARAPADGSWQFASPAATEPSPTSRAAVFRELLSYRRALRAVSDPGAVHPAHEQTAGDAGVGPEAGVAHALDELEVLFGWVAFATPAAKVGDVLKSSLQPESMPRDVRAAWERFAGTAARELTGATAGPDVATQIDELLDALRGSARTILERRILSDEPPTLEQLGEALGVTRERVRQIQVKVEGRLDDLIALPRFRLLRWRAHELSDALGSAAPLEKSTTVAALEHAVRGCDGDRALFLRALLLRLAGGYRRIDGWLIRAGTAQLPSPADLEALCDANGLLPVATAHEWLVSHGIAAAFHDEWLESKAGFRRFGDTLALWSGSIVDKCVALLAIRGVPTDADTLVKMVGEGHNVTGARNRFFSDERMRRVNRTEWSLATWGMEEYSGIAEEIAQRIAERGGRVRLSELVPELVRLFQVKEMSVRVYAAAPMFVNEDGWIRLRGPDESYTVTKPLSDCEGVYQVSAHRLCFLVPVDRETLRGSGRALAPAIGVALGVQPGESRTFRADAGQVRITWPPSSAMGASLGSIRDLVAQVGALEGEQLRLEFDLQDSTALAIRIPKEVPDARDNLSWLQVLTGVDVAGRDPLDAVAAAIGVSRERALGALRARGDSIVAELLRPPEVDAGLSDALKDLASQLLDGAT